MLLVLSFIGLETKSETCNILVLRCLGCVEPNIVMIVPLKPTSKLRFSFGIMQPRTFKRVPIFFFDLFNLVWLALYIQDCLVAIDNLLEGGACAFNRFLSSWAPNISCHLIYHVSLNLLVTITLLFYHMPPQTQFPPHLPCKPHTTHQFPFPFKQTAHHLLVFFTDP